MNVDAGFQPRCGEWMATKRRNDKIGRKMEWQKNITENEFRKSNEYRFPTLDSLPDL